MGKYKISRSNIRLSPETNGIVCTYTIVDKEANSENFHDIYHEVDDIEAFLVFARTNDEVYVNRGRNKFKTE